MCATDSSFVPPLIYAVLGSSRDIAIGPVAVVSLLLGTLLRKEVSPTKEPGLYLQLAFTATFFAGLFQTALGVLRYESSSQSPYLSGIFENHRQRKDVKLLVLE